VASAARCQYSATTQRQLSGNSVASAARCLCSDDSVACLRRVAGSNTQVAGQQQASDTRREAVGGTTIVVTTDQLPLISFTCHRVAAEYWHYSGTCHRLATELSLSSCGNYWQVPLSASVARGISPLLKKTVMFSGLLGTIQ